MIVVLTIVALLIAETITETCLPRIIKVAVGSTVHGKHDGDLEGALYPRKYPSRLSPAACLEAGLRET